MTCYIRQNNFSSGSIFRYFPNLQQLDMSLSPVQSVTSGVPMETINFVTEFGQLEHLRLLRIRSYTPESGKFLATVLAESLKHLTSLETLNLAGNRIGYDGVIAVTGGLKSLTSLKTLDLSMSGMGDRSAAKLAEGIKHLPSLETLNLAWNEIGYDGIVALTGGIKNSTSLKMLNLSHNKIGGRSAAKLMEGIKHLTSLHIMV